MRPRLKQFTPHNSLKYSVLEPDTLLGKTFSLSFSVSLLSLSSVSLSAVLPESQGVCFHSLRVGVRCTRHLNVSDKSLKETGNAYDICCVCCAFRNGKGSVKTELGFVNVGIRRLI